MKRIWLMPLLMTLLLPPLISSAADPQGAARLKDSIQVLSTIMASPETAIPPILLQKAVGVVIIPNMIKASFLVGARYGKGVLLVRNKDGRWGNPVLITVTGGSFGLQMGVQSTDLILVFRRSRALDLRSKRNIILGADVSIVAGRLSLKLDENIEASPEGELYSFSKTAGLNAGFALQGASLRMDDAATAALYGKSSLSAQDILSGRVDTVMPAILKFKETFTRLAGKIQ